MKFSKIQKQKIKTAKAKIQALAKKQDIEFSKLCKFLKTSEEANDWLVDYVFNNFGTLKLIENCGQVKPTPYIRPVRKGVVVSPHPGLKLGETVDILGFNEFSDELVVRPEGDVIRYSIHHSCIKEIK